jgi:DDE family transposase
LRLIVRRVPISAEELRQGSPKARRRKTIPPEQLQMVLDGELSSTYGYSFIVSDIPTAEMTTAEVERFHRQRAQIEERFKDAKLGQALRHLPSGKPAANRLWLCCSLLALNICAWLCDVSPAAAASGQALDEDTPQRRHAKTLRHLLFCVPGRIVRTARRTIVRLANGFPHFQLFNATYHAAPALPRP